MPFTTPATWSTNEVVTAAKMNTHVRDNISFLGSPPMCSVKASGVQAISTAVSTVLLAGTETKDTDGMHSTSVNTSRITINTAGHYLVSATVRFAVNATGVRFQSFYIDATTEDAMQQLAAVSGSDTVLSGTRSYTFTAGQFVEVRAHQASGVNLNVTLEDFTAVLIAVP